MSQNNGVRLAMRFAPFFYLQIASVNRSNLGLKFASQGLPFSRLRAPQGLTSLLRDE
jgi:hypothetical protein